MMDNCPKILVVGAGFSGSTIARCLADSGFHVTVIDRRNHIAGNAYDEFNEFSIRIHHYGPHIFHTSNKRVIGFLSRFTDWVPYSHKVKAILKNGEFVPFPVNTDTVKKVGIENVLDIFFRPYTRKMWACEIEELNPDVLNRVPVREDDNELYFPSDDFQKMPIYGYSKLIENMLDHKNIELILSCSYENYMDKKFTHVFNSMSIDEYFGYDLGVLPYRSIKFHSFSIPVPHVLPTATVNFTHNDKYTRATEWKKFPLHGENISYTTITVEEPCDFIQNNFERYYPIKDIKGENRGLYNKYKSRIPHNHSFIGRCGLYAYLDMDQAVNSSLRVASKFLDEFSSR